MNIYAKRECFSLDFPLIFDIFFVVAKRNIGFAATKYPLSLS